MIILVDQDGPMADFEQGVINVWQKWFPNESFVPIENRRNFYTRLDYPKELRGRIDEIQYSKNFYADLPIVAGCFEAISEMLALGYNVRICSAPSSKYENCVGEKYFWVEKHFGREFTRRIILTKDKTLIKGNFLIDDRPLIEDIDTAEWEHILYDAPYNRHISDKKRLTWSNWKTILGL